MKSSYYLQNNVSLVIGILHVSLKIYKQVEISRLLLLLPMLLDDKIVTSLQDKNKEYTFGSLILQNNIPLANYNDRYLSLLPLAYQAISILLDIEAIGLRNGKITIDKLEILEEMKDKSQSIRLNLIYIATQRLFAMIENDNITRLYSVLKIQL